MSEPQTSPITVGSHGNFQWLVSTEHWLDDLLKLFPEIVLEKYVAITSTDSGSFFPDDEEKALGWEQRKDITYSPRIQSVDMLPIEGFDEWYVSETPFDLGQLYDRGANPFLKPGANEDVLCLVNSWFDLRKPSHDVFAAMFWPQMDRIRPQSYVSDCTTFVTFVTADKAMFTRLRRALDEPES